MNTREQINAYIAAQPESKRSDMQALHGMILKLIPGCKLWFQARSTATLYLMVGLPCSGKTTLAQQLEIGRQLLQAAAAWLDSDVPEFQDHGWRYSKPIHVEQTTCQVLNEAPWLVMAGDAFGGPRVEGAALSGWSAAAVLKQSPRC
jgi:hypothetical protein